MSTITVSPVVLFRDAAEAVRIAISEISSQPLTEGLVKDLTRIAGILEDRSKNEAKKADVRPIPARVPTVTADTPPASADLKAIEAATAKKPAAAAKVVAEAPLSREESFAVEEAIEAKLLKSAEKVIVPLPCICSAVKADGKKCTSPATKGEFCGRHAGKPAPKVKVAKPAPAPKGPKGKKTVQPAGTIMIADGKGKYAVATREQLVAALAAMPKAS